MNGRAGFAVLAAALAAAFALRPEAPGPAPRARVTSYRTSDAAIDALQPYFRDTLESNRKQFPGRAGPVAGFGAGAHYPQVWVRDSATLVPLVRWHYPRTFLTSWVEEHLAHQRADGSVNDWIAPGEPSRFAADAPQVRPSGRGPAGVMSADRNTSESDQESSLVLAAAAAFRATGDLAWLQRPVEGVTLIDRLDAALASMAGLRTDPASGLITAAFTADWGDVTPVYGDQRVLYRDENTPVVAALYPSALFAGAARELAVLFEALSRPDRARVWADRAGAMDAAVQEALWQPGAGFFAMHRVISSPPGWTAPDDAGTFALGGNAMAMLHGLADPAQCAAISAAAQRARTQHGLSSIATVLVPPYPSGFFQHPILSEPWTYQNGGQWDWWAGRFVLAQFRCGQSVAARRHLGELARDILAAGGLHEWRDRAGAGRGSARYAGSAGALGAAIYGGLFGIDLRADGLDLRVRLAAEDGAVRAWQPATRTGVWYRYDYDEARRLATLDYESDAPGRGRVALLLPQGASAALVRLDGREVPFETERVGDDVYIVVETDWAERRMQVELL